MVPWGKFLTKREGEDEHEQHTRTRAPLAPKGALCTQSSIAGTRGPLAPILCNIIINALSTDPQKRSRKFGTQGLHSKGHCKSSVLEPAGQSQLELQEDRDTPKNSSVTDSRKVFYFCPFKWKSENPGSSEVTGQLSHRRDRDLTSYTTKPGNFTIWLYQANTSIRRETTQ